MEHDDRLLSSLLMSLPADEQRSILDQIGTASSLANTQSDSVRLDTERGAA